MEQGGETIISVQASPESQLTDAVAVFIEEPDVHVQEVSDILSEKETSQGV